MPDPATFVPLPYAPGAGAMLADQVLPSGEPWDGCARTYLKQAIAAAAAEGYAVTAAFEPEFTLGRREADPAGGPDRLVPNDDSLCYSATGFHLAHDYTMDLLGALTAQGLRPEHYYPELGHGQQEMTVRYAPALRAADNHVLYRETVRGTAFRRGLWASLAPKPIPDQAGNGAHLHISLRDVGPDGRLGATPVFYDAADSCSLSATGYHFIGGLLAHLPALVALTCGSVNSYRRLAPQMWSSAYTVYGMDNREAAVRICSPMSDNKAASVNLELKPSDSSANPYLALGAVIHAGLDGIRRKLDPGEAVNVDPAVLTEDERLAPRCPPPARFAGRGAGLPGGGHRADGLPRRPAPPRLPGGEALRGGRVRGHDHGPGVLRALHQDLDGAEHTGRPARAAPPPAALVPEPGQHDHDDDHHGHYGPEPYHHGAASLPFRHRVQNASFSGVAPRPGVPEIAQSGRSQGVTPQLTKAKEARP